MSHLLLPATVWCSVSGERLLWLCWIPCSSTTALCTSHETVTSAISASRSALKDLADPLAAAFAELSLTYSSLPVDLAAKVFPAAKRHPASDEGKQIVNILDTTSAARVQAVVQRVRMTLLTMLQLRNIEHHQSASLLQLASALSEHASKPIAIAKALPPVNTTPVPSQNDAADVKVQSDQLSHSNSLASGTVTRLLPAPVSVPLRSSDRLRVYTATGLYPGGNNCFLNALTQQIVTDPDMPAFLRQAAAFGKTVSGDFKSFDRADTLALCDDFSRIVDAVAKGNAVQTKDMSRLRIAMKLEGLRQEDCHEAYIKLTISPWDQLKHTANPEVKTRERDWLTFVE